MRPIVFLLVLIDISAENADLETMNESAAYVSVHAFNFERTNANNYAVGTQRQSHSSVLLSIVLYVLRRNTKLWLT